MNSEPNSEQALSFNYFKSKGWDRFEFGCCSVEDYAAIAAEFSGCNSCQNVLEVGFGNGAVMSYLDSRGVNCTGIELNEALVAAAKMKGFEAFSSMDLLIAEGRKFDVIIALDVIEHISKSKLMSFFGTLYSLLQDTGKVYLRFPNGDSPFGRISQYSDLTHETVIGRGLLEMMTFSTQFKIIQLRSPKIPIMGFGFARASKRLLIVISRRIAEKIISLIFLGGLPVPLDPNYFAILGKKLKS